MKVKLRLIDEKTNDIYQIDESKEYLTCPMCKSRLDLDPISCPCCKRMFGIFVTAGEGIIK